MPYHLNLLVAVLLLICAVFTGYKVVGYVSLVLASPLQVIESGYDPNQVKQVYAFGRATVLLVACGLIVYFSPFPQMITRIIGFYFFRLAIELLLSIKSTGVYVASMLVFYEGLMPDQESDSEGQAFRTLVRGTFVLKESGEENDARSSLMHEPVGVLMRVYAAHCKKDIRKRAITGKASAAVWSAVLFAIAWYAVGI